jgi:hypothetical protein
MHAIFRWKYRSCPALLFTKTLQKTYIATTIQLPGRGILSHLFKQRDLNIVAAQKRILKL